MKAYHPLRTYGKDATSSEKGVMKPGDIEAKIQQVLLSSADLNKAIHNFDQSKGKTRISGCFTKESISCAQALSLPNAPLGVCIKVEQLVQLLVMTLELSNLADTSHQISAQSWAKGTYCAQADLDFSKCPGAITLLLLGYVEFATRHVTGGEGFLGWLSCKENISSNANYLHLVWEMQGQLCGPEMGLMLLKGCVADLSFQVPLPFALEVLVHWEEISSTESAQVFGIKKGLGYLVLAAGVNYFKGVNKGYHFLELDYHFLWNPRTGIGTSHSSSISRLQYKSLLNF